MKRNKNYFIRICLKKTRKRDWVRGFGLWDWKAILYPESEASKDSDYAVFGKSAEKNNQGILSIDIRILEWGSHCLLDGRTSFYIL